MLTGVLISLGCSLSQAPGVLDRILERNVITIRSRSPHRVLVISPTVGENLIVVSTLTPACCFVLFIPVHYTLWERFPTGVPRFSRRGYTAGRGAVSRPRQSERWRSWQCGLRLALSRRQAVGTRKRCQLCIRVYNETFSSPRCASTIQIVRPLRSIAETQPQLQPALLRLSAIIDFPIRLPCRAWALFRRTA